MKYPYIPPIEGVSDLLDLLGNSKAFKERLELLNGVLTAINKQTATYNDYQDIDEERQKAAALLVEAKEILQKAMKDAERVKIESDSYHQRKTEEADTLLKEAETKTALLDQHQAQLNAREAQLNVLDQQVKDASKALEEKMERTELLKSDAERTKAEYHQRLKRLQEAAAG